ncbi:hypothetical protein Tco_0032184 [Tanacetum coccineum]
MCIPFTGIAQFPDVAHNLEILQDQEDCDESERSGKKQDGSDNHRNNNQDSGNNDKFLLNFSLQPLDSQQSRVFPESCTLLFMPNVVVETQESVVMLPEIASSAARLATSSKMARRTLRQVHLVTLTRKPDISGRVFAITQNQTTNISEELSGISSIRDVEYDTCFVLAVYLVNCRFVAWSDHVQFGVRNGLSGEYPSALYFSLNSNWRLNRADGQTEFEAQDRTTS